MMMTWRFLGSFSGVIYSKMSASDGLCTRLMRLAACQRSALPLLRERNAHEMKEFVKILHLVRKASGVCKDT
jgi:hypothetical protein